jgi:hypothetical protein
MLFAELGFAVAGILLFPILAISAAMEAVASLVWLAIELLGWLSHLAVRRLHLESRSSRGALPGPSASRGRCCWASRCWWWSY